MKKLFIFISVSCMIACGTSEKEVTDTRTPQEKSRFFSDSAMALYRSGGLNQDILVSNSLLDSAIAYDVKNRKAYDFKTAMYTKTGDYDGVYNTLILINKNFPTDPVSKLRLGMEQELRGDTATALENYNKSIEMFRSVLDTLSAKSEAIRTTYEMNLALAEILASTESEKAASKQKDMDSPIKTSIYEQFGDMPRQELLQQRRKKK